MGKSKSIIPEFGPFSGMRVLSAGSLVAMPHAGAMLADFGAEVIHIERPGVGDTFRVLSPFSEKSEKFAPERQRIFLVAKPGQSGYNHGILKQR